MAVKKKLLGKYQLALRSDTKAIGCLLVNDDAFIAAFWEKQAGAKRYIDWR